VTSLIALLLLGLVVALLLRAALAGELSRDTARDNAAGWEHWILDRGLRPVPPAMKVVTACAQTLSGDDVEVLRAALRPSDDGQVCIVTEQRLPSGRVRYAVSNRTAGVFDPDAAEGATVTATHGWLHVHADRRTVDPEALPGLWDQAMSLDVRQARPT
jgi:hypothetical protein